MTQPFATDMLEFLVCPETHQPLALADEALLGRLKARQAAGKLKNRGGNLLADPLQAALVREDRQYAYAVLDGFPVMLIDEALPLAQLSED